MRLTVLGTSTPYPRPDAPCSGYLLQHESTSVWIDAGTGTLAELQRHIALADLGAIWISHAHADHSADLLTAYYALRFSEIVPASPIPLIGPPGLAARLVAFLGPGSASKLPEVFELTEMQGWGDAVAGGIRLEWGPVDHGLPAFGLRASAAGESFAYSGDTGYCTSLVELAEGADLFLCEAGYDAHPAGEPAVHCTPEDAGRMAAEAGVARLMLTHIDNRLDPAAAADRSGFAGASVATPGLSVPGLRV